MRLAASGDKERALHLPDKLEDAEDYEKYAVTLAPAIYGLYAIGINGSHSTPRYNPRGRLIGHFSPAL